MSNTFLTSTQVTRKALMILHHARRRARVNPAGELVLLEDQDRVLWDP